MSDDSTARPTIASVLERWRRLCSNDPRNPTTLRDQWMVLLQLEQDIGKGFFEGCFSSLV